MKPFTLLILLFNACALPTPRPSAPDTIQNGGTKEDALIASAARFTQIITEKKEPHVVGENEILFKCEGFLKNEKVSNPKLCQGVAFLFIDSNHKMIKRFFANENGVFQYSAPADKPHDEKYSIELEDKKKWTLKKEGPFYTGRQYLLTIVTK